MFYLRIKKMYRINKEQIDFLQGLLEDSRVGLAIGKSKRESVAAILSAKDMLERLREVKVSEVELLLHDFKRWENENYSVNSRDTVEPRVQGFIDREE